MVFNTIKLVAFFIFSLSAFSSSDHHEINWWKLGLEHQEAPAIGWLSITFLIFVFSIAYILKKPLGLYLETRSKDIRRQIEEGKRAKEESERKLKLYEEKLQSLDREIEQLRQGFLAQEQAERAERERTLKVLLDRIAHDADDTIKSSILRSKTRLTEEVIAAALTLAEKTIKEHKKEEIDEALKHAFIKDLKHAAQVQ